MSGPSWKDVNPALIRIFGTLALPNSGNPQDPAWAPQWRDRPLKAVPMKGPLNGTALYLRITSVAGIGEDDRRLEFVPPATVAQDVQAGGVAINAGGVGVTVTVAGQPTPYDNAYREVLYGLRRVTLSLEAQMSDVTFGDAMGFLEQIRSRLRRRRVIDDMLALNIAQVRTEASRALPTKAESHIRSRATMDVILTMTSSDVDPIPTGWIATLSISSRIQNTDGTVLSVPPNFNDLIVNLP